MKKYMFWSKLTMLILMFCTSISFVSCGNDDEEEKDNNPTIVGWMRGKMQLQSDATFSNGTGNIGTGTIGTGNGSGSTFLGTTALDFHSDGTVYYYNLANTGSTSGLSGEGKWTPLAVNTDWSYFNGIWKFGDELKEEKNPQVFYYTFKLDENKVTLTDNEGKVWAIFYVDLDTTTNTWSCFKDSKGKTQYVPWKEPIDNSQFD